MQTLIKPVATLLRSVADAVVLPRYQSLAASEIEEKTPGELVTIADRESEIALAAGLAQILPDTRFLGEEAVAADPTLMAGVDSGAVWIIDPIDGTANFAAGKPPFALMIALAVDGLAQVAWIYDPLTRRLCHAVRGGGAWINGERVTARETGCEKPVAAIGTLFMTEAAREDILNRAASTLELAAIPRCAGEQYPRVVLGQNDIAVFERTLPWDHVPGALFVEEAGGKAVRIDGSPYHFADGCRGLLAASSPAMWDHAARVLYG